MVTQKLAELF